MRFDKDIWSPSCSEYADRIADPSRLAHLTGAVRVFLSYWLELLQDDRSPETRALRSLAIPDQLSDLLNAFRLTKDDGKRMYRVRAAAARLQRQFRVLACPFVGRDELTRLCADISEWVSLVDETDQKAHAKREHAVRQKYNLAANVDVVSAIQQRIQEATVGTLSQIRGQPDYKGALVTHIRGKLNDPNTTAALFNQECGAAMRELLSLALDAGSSRESLAELPIKYLRGDNFNLVGKSLEERTRLLFGAFRGSNQEYEVFLPLDNIQLEIPGEIFPPGVSIVDSASWQAQAQDFASLANGAGIPTHGVAFKVEIKKYLESGLSEGEAYPLDVFAARDVAVRAAQACLDAVFLYREHRIRIEQPCGVVAHGESTHKCVLHHRHDFQKRTRITLPFLRPVPSAWADALHWYRIGHITNKDESGIVNLWTSAELLAASCHGMHGAALDRVRSSVGTTSALILFTDQQLYLANAARAYARQFHRENAVNLPSARCNDNELLEWWLNLCSANDEGQLFGAVFDMFPQLAVDALAVKATLGPGDQRSHYDGHKQAILDELAWIYSCRNDVVHDGRTRIRGAAIARAVAAEYVGTTLQATLAMRARGNTTSLNECFALAAEKERTLRWHLENGRMLDSLLTAYS